MKASDLTVGVPYRLKSGNVATVGWIDRRCVGVTYAGGARLNWWSPSSFARRVSCVALRIAQSEARGSE